MDLSPYAPKSHLQLTTWRARTVHFPHRSQPPGEPLLQDNRKLRGAMTKNRIEWVALSPRTHCKLTGDQRSRHGYPQSLCLIASSNQAYRAAARTRGSSVPQSVYTQSGTHSPPEQSYEAFDLNKSNPRDVNKTRRWSTLALDTSTFKRGRELLPQNPSVAIYCKQRSTKTAFKG